KPSKIEVIEAVPVSVTKWVRGWDLGATVGGDPTAGIKLGLDANGSVIIADLAHGDLGPDERDLMIKNAAISDGLNTTISIPQDPGQAGKTQILYLTRMLQGFTVKSSPESGDKITR
ncbi:terminase, partial [Glaesserella parasuis]|nr:terminase [Glaesserella parasuis]